MRSLVGSLVKSLVGALLSEGVGGVEFESETFDVVFARDELVPERLSIGEEVEELSLSLVRFFFNKEPSGLGMMLSTDRLRVGVGDC